MTRQVISFFVGLILLVVAGENDFVKWTIPLCIIGCVAIGWYGFQLVLYGIRSLINDEE